jgi:hypothetical protein
VLELVVRALLANHLEPEISQDSHHLIGLENGDAATHAGASNRDSLGADEFRLQARFTILQQHRYHFAEILLQFVQRLTLRVGSGKTRNKPHKETGLRAFFHNGCEGTHWWKISFLRPTARRAGSREAKGMKLEFET